jgi:AraC-like DNA-binding protein
MKQHEVLTSHLEKWLRSELRKEADEVTIQHIYKIAEAAALSKLTVLQLGKILKRSRRQTYRVIHHLYKKPAGKLLIQIELHKAHYLLKSMKFQTISEFMDQIKWSNQFYFSLLFKSEFRYHPKTMISK